MRWILAVCLAMLTAGCLDDLTQPPCPVYDENDPDCEDRDDDSDPGYPHDPPDGLLVHVLGTNAVAWAGRSVVVQIHDEQPLLCAKTVVSSAGTFELTRYINVFPDHTYGALVVLHGDDGNDYDPSIDAAWSFPIALDDEEFLVEIDGETPPSTLPLDDICDGTF